MYTSPHGVVLGEFLSVDISPRCYPRRDPYHHLLMGHSHLLQSGLPADGPLLADTWFSERPRGKYPAQMGTWCWKVQSSPGTPSFLRGPTEQEHILLSSVLLFLWKESGPPARCGGSHLESQQSGRPRQVDHLGSGV